MSLGAKALACPGAEARPPGLGGEQLKPVWRGCSGGLRGPVAAGGRVRMRPRAGRRAAVKVVCGGRVTLLCSCLSAIHVGSGPQGGSCVGNPWGLPPRPRLPWGPSGLFYQSPPPTPGNRWKPPQDGAGGLMTKGDRVWGFHPCG